jgi:hypothetical protein
MPKYQVRLRYAKLLEHAKIVDVEVTGVSDFEIVVTTSSVLSTQELNALQNKFPFAEITKIEG